MWDSVLRQVALVLLACAASAVASTAAPAEWCGGVRRVRFIIDGDTIDVAAVGRVRLLGIDAPEMGSGFERPAPFALEARMALQSLVLHRWVRLECDGPTTDDYGRRLAYVWLEVGEFVNARLVRDGLARATTRRRLLRWHELLRAEDEARGRRRGMWGVFPAVPPESYRLPRAKRKR